MKIGYGETGRIGQEFYTSFPRGNYAGQAVFRYNGRNIENKGSRSRDRRRTCTLMQVESREQEKEEEYGYEKGKHKDLYRL